MLNVRYIGHLTKLLTRNVRYLVHFCYLRDYDNQLNNKIMPRFSFETRANKRVSEIIAKQSSNKSENIIATPFIIDPEYVDKHITISLKENTKNQDFISTSKQVKLGNYCICLQAIGDMIPYWQSKSNYASLIIGYIIKNIQLYGNYVEIQEKEFINYAGIHRQRFYEGLNALLRPAYPYPCAADNMSLLAATTRKSIYVVNHNFIFRGNYDEFITLYELKFPNGCKLDSRGRVIIDR